MFSRERIKSKRSPNSNSIMYWITTINSAPKMLPKRNLTKFQKRTRRRRNLFSQLSNSSEWEITELLLTLLWKKHSTKFTRKLSRPRESRTIWVSGRRKSENSNQLSRFRKRTRNRRVKKKSLEKGSQFLEDLVEVLRAKNSRIVFQSKWWTTSPRMNSNWSTHRKLPVIRVHQGRKRQGWAVLTVKEIEPAIFLGKAVTVLPQLLLTMTIPLNWSAR